MYNGLYLSEIGIGLKFVQSVYMIVFFFHSISNMNRGLLIVVLVIIIGYYLKKSNLDQYTNIYTSNFTKQAQDLIEKELGKRYEQSLNPEETGVYNPIISSFGANALEKDTNQLQKQFNDIRYRNLREEQLQTMKKKDDIVEKKVIIPAMDGDFFSYKGKSSEISSITGLPIELNPDVQPFFSKLTQNVEKFDSSRLDHALGNSLSFKKKDAVERFTDGYTVPNANMSQVVYTDHVDQSRFIPSIYHQGVPVVQPELLAKPTFGVYDNKLNHRTGEKTLEELRPIHTKSSFTFEPVQGTTNVDQVRGELGHTTKQKIKSFKENTFDDYYKGPGAYIAESAPETFNVKDTNKVYYADRNGGAKGSDNPESRFGDDGYRPILKSTLPTVSANLTGTNKMMKGTLTDYSSVGTHRETLDKLPLSNPNINTKGIVLPQEVSLRTLREDFKAKPLANPKGPFTNSLEQSRNSGLVNYNAQTTTKEIGLKGYIGGTKRDQLGNYLTESYNPRTTLKELVLQKDKLGLASDTNRGTMSYEGNINYQNDKAIIKETAVETNRIPNKSSALGNGNIGLNNVTLKEYINRPTPLYYTGTSIITGVDNIGTRESSDKVIGGIDRFPPMKSNTLQDYNRIEFGSKTLEH